MAKPFVDLLGSLGGKLAAAKLRVFWSREGDRRRALYFVEATDGAHLVRPCNQISRHDRVRRPVCGGGGDGGCGRGDASRRGVKIYI